jgi:hypothetical protein
VSYVCGNHRAYIYERGGVHLISELTPLTAVQWQRIRDDISSASITVPTFECCDVLSELRTCKHELHIVRNGVTVWQGVVTRIEYEVDETRVYAEDLLWVAKRSAIEVGYSHAYPNIGLALDRMDALLTECYSRLADPWNMLPHLRKLVGVDGPRTSRNVFAWQMSVWEDLDKYAEDYGTDYVMINRDLFYFDIHLQWQILSPLNESFLSDPPRIVEYGNQAGTRAIVTNGHGFAGVSVPDPTHVLEFGLIDLITTNEIDGQVVGDPTAEEVASWADTATRHVTQSFPPPVGIVIPANTTLLPGAPWGIQQMVPGAWFKANVDRYCRTVEDEWQRIHEVVVTEESPAGEQIKFTAVSAPRGIIEYTGTPITFPPDT